MAQHDDRALCQGHRYIIARFGHLTFMAHIEPGTAEQPFHFQLKDVLVQIGIPMDLMVLGQARQGGLVIGITHSASCKYE